MVQNNNNNHVLVFLTVLGVNWSQDLLCGAVGQTGAGGGHWEGVLTPLAPGLEKLGLLQNLHLHKVSPHGLSSMAISRWPDFLPDGSGIQRHVWSGESQVGATSFFLTHLRSHVVPPSPRSVL